MESPWLATPPRFYPGRTIEILLRRWTYCYTNVHRLLSDELQYDSYTEKDKVNSNRLNECFTLYFAKFSLWYTISTLSSFSCIWHSQKAIYNNLNSHTALSWSQSDSKNGILNYLAIIWLFLVGFKIDFNKCLWNSDNSDAIQNKTKTFVYSLRKGSPMYMF